MAHAITATPQRAQLLDRSHRPETPVLSHFKRRLYSSGSKASSGKAAGSPSDRNTHRRGRMPAPHWGFLVTDSCSRCGEGLSIKQQGESNQNTNMNRSHEVGTGGFSHYISMGKDQKVIERISTSCTSLKS